MSRRHASLAGITIGLILVASTLVHAQSPEDGVASFAAPAVQGEQFLFNHSDGNDINVIAVDGDTARGPHPLGHRSGPGIRHRRP